jgi:hypothetical protein
LHELAETEQNKANNYGRELGTDHKNLPIETIMYEAKRKTEKYNHSSLKEALSRLLEVLEEGERMKIAHPFFICNPV